MKGTKAFDLGIYDEAITEYMEAYRIKDDPAILYNLGQAHRLAGHAADATRFYRMYLTKVPRAENREEVELKIRELQKAVDQQQKTQQLPPDQTIGPASDPAPVPATETSAPASTTEPANAPATVVSQPDRRETHPGRTMKVAGLTVAAVGVAALATGIGLSVSALQLSDELSAPDAVFDPDKEARGQTFGVAGPALIGVGAAAAVAGAVVAGLGFRDEKRARAVAILPSVAPRQAGIFVSARF